MSIETLPIDPDHLVESVTALLESVKAEDIVSYDLQGRSALADYMVIATGQSNRQLLAMADYLQAALKAAGFSVSIEGEELCDWVLVDGGAIIIHLFRPEIRSFYSLEKLWSGKPGDRAA